MTKLSTVTLCAISSVRIDETLRALEQSMRSIAFANVLFLTDKEVLAPHEGITIIPIEQLDYDGYSHFIIYKLKDYINTDFVLIVQHDGYVLRPEKWSDEFLRYDYIGAPWPDHVHFTPQGMPVRVGNGGFSLRSKKLLSMPHALNLPFTDNGTGYFHEDGVICAYHRKALEDAGVLFAPVEVAARFSHETDCKESAWKPFGFHGSKHVWPRILWPIKKLFRQFNIHI